MHSAEVKTRVYTDIKIGNRDANAVLREICDACHEGIISASLQHQYSEDKPLTNTAKSWKITCEHLEGILCRILDILGD